MYATNAGVSAKMCTRWIIHNENTHTHPARVCMWHSVPVSMQIDFHFTRRQKWVNIKSNYVHSVWMCRVCVYGYLDTQFRQHKKNTLKQNNNQNIILNVRVFGEYMLYRQPDWNKCYVNRHTYKKNTKKSL